MRILLIISISVDPHFIRRSVLHFMKIALVHDQLQEFGGAERVLVALKKIFPQADVYTSFYNAEALGTHRDNFKDWKIITSWADKIPFIKKIYSPLRFITPWIWESFDFSQYNLVISSSGSYMSKGVITKPKTLHLQQRGRFSDRVLFGLRRRLQVDYRPGLLRCREVQNRLLLRTRHHRPLGD